MNKTIAQLRSGFTLMEIMVVIIIIAVLASVAGPMIVTITDQCKASATKASMQNLKTALVNFNNDIGHFPHTLTLANAATTIAADTGGMNNDMGGNCLVNNNVSAGAYSNCGVTAYGKRWKGPYMDSAPEDFMMDAWELKIKYTHYNLQIWLQSAGSDGGMDSIVSAVAGTYANDDLTSSVTRVKF